MSQDPQPTRTAAASPARRAFVVLAVAAVYLAAAYAGLAFASSATRESLVWPAAGLALAAVVLGGPWFAAAVFLGGLVFDLASGVPPALALLLSTGRAAGALAGRHMVQGSGDFSPRLEKVRDVVWLVAGGAVVSPLVAATAGTLALLGAGSIAAADAAHVWLTWWRGDALGILFLAPAILTWASARRPAGAVAPAAGIALAAGAALAIGGAFVASTLVVAADHGGVGAANVVVFALFALSMWPATRLPVREVATFMLAMAACTILATAAGFGPFAAEYGESALSVLHSFLAFVALTALLVAAAGEEGRAARRELAASEARFRSLTEPVSYTHL
ncbi:MAG: MASE1 domain-containing protein, partial [Burkholderiales bacterium]|nr:MASE1 domain-containing protein [Burkholderiales bacterium]